MKMDIRLPILTTLLLSACSVSVEQVAKATADESLLESALPCCGSYSDFKYLPVATANTKFQIDKFSPVFDFKTGRSYFAAFELTPGTGRKFRLKSYFADKRITGPYFKPIALVLDAQYLPLESREVDSYFTEGNVFSDPYPHMTGFVTIDDQAKYLVVHTEPFSSTTRVMKSSPQGTGYMGGRSFIQVNPEGDKIQVTPSPIGVIKLELMQ